jgi:hypothetical protein
MQKSTSKEKLEPIHENMQEMVEEDMHRCDELDQVGVARLQSINTLVSEEMDAASLAPSSDVYDAALAPGHEVCGVALAPGHETCETALAPGREMEMNVKTVDCEEIMGVDQLPICSVRGGQDIVVQIGQSVELKASPVGNIRRKKVSKVFPIFTSKLYTDKQIQNYDNSRGKINTLLFTPSKLRKLCKESNTVTGSSDANFVDNLQSEISESPAKRRKYCDKGQSTKMAATGD